MAVGDVIVTVEVDGDDKVFLVVAIGLVVVSCMVGVPTHRVSAECLYWVVMLCYGVVCGVFVVASFFVCFRIKFIMWLNMGIFWRRLNFTTIGLVKLTVVEACDWNGILITI